METFAMLFNSIFGGGATSKPIFSRRKCDDKLEFFQNDWGFFCGPARDPLQKVGQRGGSTSKIRTGRQRTDLVANFKRLVLRAQKELSAQISGANQLGVKVLFFGVCCMLSVSYFGLKLWLNCWKGVSRWNSSLSEIFLFFCLVRCFEKRLE